MQIRSSMLHRSFFVFLFLLLLYLRSSFAGHQFCNTARVVCNITDQPSEGSLCNSGCSGNNNLVNGSNSCFSGGLTRWGFYMFTIKQSGTLTIYISPDPPGFFDDGDYNFALFDVSNGCGSLGNALRCSNSYNSSDPAQDIGLNMSATDTTEGAGGDGWLKYINVQCGHTYLLCLDIPNNDGNGFALSFGGTALFGAPQTSFTASPASVCTNQPVTFTLDTSACFVSNPFITYTWDFGPNATPSTYSGTTPPAVTFSTPGAQTIELTTNFTAGSTCTTINTQVYNVISVPPGTPTFSVSAPACVGNSVTVTYTGTASGTATYNWNFDGGVIMSGSGAGPYTIVWSTPGTINVTLDVSDCSSTSPTTTVPVTVTVSPTSTFTATSPVCVGENSTITYTGTGLANASYPWNFDGGTIVSGSGQGPLTVDWSTAGIKNLTLTVTDSNGCTSPQTAVNITVNALPVVTAGADLSYCSGSNAVIGSPPQGGQTYSWFPTTGLSSSAVANPTVTISNMGSNPLIENYVVTATINNCSLNDTVQVTVNPVPVSEAGAAVIFCSGDSAGIGTTATTGYTYSWNPVSGLNVATVSGPTVSLTNITSNPLTTEYFVTTTFFGCTTSDSVVVTVNQMPVTDAGADVAYCSGSSAAIGSPPQAGYTYTWMPTTDLSSSTAANPTVIISNSGSSNIVVNYIVTATVNNCSLKDTVQVTVYPLPTSSFSATGPVCVAESAVIAYTGNASPAASYIWDFDGGTVISGSGQGPYLISWPVSGTKNITLTVLENGCLSTTTTVIALVNPPDANAGADVSYCSGGTAFIGGTSTAGFSYSWNPTTGLSSGTSSNPSVTLTNTGANPVTTNYIVTTTLAGCTITDTVAVTVNPEPVSSAGPDVGFCSGSSAVIGTSNNIYYTYIWTPPGGLTNASVSSPTVSLTHSGPVPLVVTYTVTTTFAAYGCVTSDTMKVTVYQIPTSTFTAPPTICENQIATIAYTGNATTGANYIWSFGGGSASPGIGQGPHNVVWSNAGTVNITLQVSENTCASSSTSSSVVVKPSPVSYAGQDVTFCSGSGAFIGTTTTAGYSYSWSPSADLSNATVSDPYVVLFNLTGTPITGVYYVTTSQTGCALTDSVLVTVNPLPVSDAGTYVGFCSGGSVIIGTTSTVGYTYLWTPTNGLNNSTISGPAVSSTNGTANPISTTYFVTTTYFGCITSDSVVVTVNPVPVSNAGADVSFCSGGNASIGTPPATGYIYSWTPVTGLSGSTFADPSITLANPVNMIQQINYIVTTTVFNCVTTDTVLVTVYPIPTASFTPPGGQCLGNNSFSFAGNGTFLPSAAFGWDFGINSTPEFSSVQNPSGINFSTAGTQLVSFTIIQFGCTSNVALNTVDVYPMPLISYSTGNSSGCQPLAVNITDNSTGVSPSVYLWEFGDGAASTSVNPSYTYLSDGIFTVTVTVSSGDGCTTKDASTMITVWQKPIGKFSFSPEKPTELYPKVIFTDESSGNNTGWIWAFGDGDSTTFQNPLHVYPDTGTFCITLLVTTLDGCKDTTSQCLRVLPEFVFFLPNAFTPNNEGGNDFFSPKFIGVDVNEFEMTVFSRWGGIVYRSKNPNSAWDGKFPDGTPAKEDVYAWIIKLKDVLGAGHKYVGHVTLIR